MLNRLLERPFDFLPTRTLDGQESWPNDDVIKGWRADLADLSVLEAVAETVAIEEVVDLILGVWNRIAIVASNGVPSFALLYYDLDKIQQLLDIRRKQRLAQGFSRLPSEVLKSDFIYPPSKFGSDFKTPAFAFAKQMTKRQQQGLRRLISERPKSARLRQPLPL